MNNENKSDILNVTGLWKSKDKNGNTYLSGPWGAVRVMIFENTNKKHDKSPDYFMKLAMSEKREEQRGSQDYSQTEASDIPF